MLLAFTKHMESENMERELKFREYDRMYLYQTEEVYGKKMLMFAGIVISKRVLVQAIGKRTAYVYAYHKGMIVASYVLRRPFRLVW